MRHPGPEPDADAAPRLTLTTLPWDVIISVLAFVRPLDIYSIRKTCKILHDATRQHVVWINALRGVCYDNNLYLEFFSPEEMPLLHLEHAATMPSRFIRRVKDTIAFDNAYRARLTPPTPALEDETPPEESENNKLPYLAPLFIRELEIPAVPGPPVWNLEDAVSELRLAPGGRYLAMNHYWDMQIWDLGLSTSEKPRLIAHRTFPGNGDFVIYGIWVKPDGRGLQIQTNFLCMEPAQNDLAIWEIYPSDPNPVLTQVASLVRGPMLTYECRGGSRIAISEESRVGVWDPTLNTLVTWDVPVDMVTMLVIQTRAICLYKDSIAVYEVPHITPRPHRAFVEESRKLTPIWTTLLPYSVDDYFLPASWPYTAEHGSPRGDLYFGLTEASPPRNYVYRVPARPLPVSEAAAIDLVAIVDVEGPVPERLDNFLQRPVRMCEGHLALMSEPESREEVRLQILEEPHPGRAFLNALMADDDESGDLLPGRMPGAWIPRPMTPLPAGPSPSPLPQTVPEEYKDKAMRAPTWSVALWRGNNDITDFEFDGASGRACAITEDYDVLVLDYLEAPKLA
ncbi:hypothetical protein HDZ31DRAFT_83982 [Schizophyllum fasciatum]